jgi:hypothetical protein
MEELDSVYRSSDGFPHGVLGLAAICGLLAAYHWMQVYRSVDSSGESLKGQRIRNMADAALLTSFALALASAGYLIGRFTGKF